MLSRRQLRVKVLQALYAFFQAEKRDSAVAEREMFRSVEKVHELYIYLLQWLVELAEADRADEEELKNKYFPDQDEQNAVSRLSRFTFFRALAQDTDFRLSVKRWNTTWQKDHELVRKVFFEYKRSPEFRELITGKLTDEKEILIDILKKYLEDGESMHHHIEEENIFWSEDLSFVVHMVARTVRQWYETGRLSLFPVFKDEKDDRDFCRTLFHQTILNNKEYEEAVSERTPNWDLERIAMMDILILKMALAELIHFPGIPVKVTINEYIEISKEYSTPKSKQFVNGVIDKLAIDFKNSGKIVKSGRGLIE